MTGVDNLSTNMFDYNVNMEQNHLESDEMGKNQNQKKSIASLDTNNSQK